jgi:phosphatidylglycerol:prolipoprotein diacylglycerol transferase
VAVPSLALGLFLTRIACFLNGCCFGTVCTLPWGVIFPPVSAGSRWSR